MDTAGKPITFDSVAREAGVSRSWLYDQPDLRAEIERLRAQRHPPTPHAPVPQRQRASDASLLRRLEAATDRIKHLEAENKQLREALAHALGQQRTNAIHGDHRDTPTTKSPADHRPLLTMRRQHCPQHITAGHSHAPAISFR